MIVIDISRPSSTSSPTHSLTSASSLVPKQLPVEKERADFRPMTQISEARESSRPTTRDEARIDKPYMAHKVRPDVDGDFAGFFKSDSIYLLDSIVKCLDVLNHAEILMSVLN